MRRVDTIERDLINPEGVQQNTIRLQHPTEIIAIAQRDFVADRRQEGPAMPFVLPDDALVGHCFKDAHQRAAVRVIALQ